MRPPLLICDFDGTLTTADVGDALCERFASPSWRDVDEAWLRGEISLPDAQRRMWSTVRASREELLAHAAAVGTLRAGAGALFDAAARSEIELVIASGGFDLYIDALLGERAAVVSARYHNRLLTGPDGTVEIEFLEGLACGRCAVCKAEVLRRYLGEDRTVAFLGDGSSDRCAAAVAPRLFAIPGGELARHCAANALAYVPVDDLGVVLEELRG